LLQKIPSIVTHSLNTSQKMKKYGIIVLTSE
jgi:hypothetical protein